MYKDDSCPIEDHQEEIFLIAKESTLIWGLFQSNVLIMKGITAVSTSQD